MSRLEFDEILLDSLSTDAKQEEFYDSSFRGRGSFGLRLSGRSRKRVFFLIYSLHGKRKRISLGEYPKVSLEEAKRKAMEVVALVEQGRDPASELQRYKLSPTFGDLAEVFLREHAKTNCRPSTYREYKRIIDKELLPIWGDIKAADISSRDISLLLGSMAQENRLVMGNRTRALLSSIFNFSIDRRYLSMNPAVDTVKPALELPKERGLALSEARTLWQVLSEEETQMSAIFGVLLLTGQRPGTVMSMRWDSLTMESWRTSESKDGTARQIFLTAPVRRLLAMQEDRDRISPYVFPSSRDPQKPVSYIRKAAASLNEKCPLSFSWTPMDLRRTAEFGMLGLNVKPEVVDRVLDRTSVPARHRKFFEKYDYYEESKHALCSWAQALTFQGKSSPSPDPGRPTTRISGLSTDNADRKKDNVVPLFPTKR